MFDAYVNVFNSTLNLEEGLKNRQTDLLNTNTWGYKQYGQKLVNTDFGVVLEKLDRIESPGLPVFMKGEKLTKVAIDNSAPYVYFLVNKGDKDYVTRLGDFKFSREQRAKDTYIGQPLEERTYLTTNGGHYVMGRPIGKGPIKETGKYKDPFSDVDMPRLGESLVKTQSKTINPHEKMETGPLVPIDLTRGSNGLILDKYTEVKLNSNGVITGKKDGFWIPLYKMELVSIPNPEGLAHVGNSPYYTETEQSGLRQKAPGHVKVKPESIEKSNVTNRMTSFDYKRLKQNLNIALSLQRSNNQLLQQFQQLLQ